MSAHTCPVRDQLIFIKVNLDHMDKNIVNIIWKLVKQLTKLHTGLLKFIYITLIWNLHFMKEIFSINWSLIIMHNWIDLYLHKSDFMINENLSKIKRNINWTTMNNFSIEMMCNKVKNRLNVYLILQGIFQEKKWNYFIYLLL